MRFGVQDEIALQSHVRNPEFREKVLPLLSQALCVWLVFLWWKDYLHGLRRWATTFSGDAGDREIPYGLLRKVIETDDLILGYGCATVLELDLALTPWPNFREIPGFNLLEKGCRALHRELWLLALALDPPTLRPMRRRRRSAWGASNSLGSVLLGFARKKNEKPRSWCGRTRLRRPLTAQKVKEMFEIFDRVASGQKYTAVARGSYPKTNRVNPRPEMMRVKRVFDCVTRLIYPPGAETQTLFTAPIADVHMSFCERCQQAKTFKEMCQAVQKYAEQDQSSQRERPYSPMQICRWMD